MRKQFILLLVLACWGAGTWGAVPHEKKYADYVNPLMGTLSEIQLSTGNTYPAIARPWGMNFWMPQTGKMGNGWAYVYDHYRLRGFKQTHQPSPWINDYGQFSIMPVVGNKITEEERASWFSHKAEIAKPYYYSVYLAEHDILTEITPTERAAFFRMTFPESDESRIVIDAFDRGSYIRILPEENKIIGYTTRNSGGVPQNFKNYFVILLDKPLEYYAVWKDGKLCEGKELTDNHVGAIIGFKTRRGEKIHARVASSFIGFEQAERNLEELGELDFDGVKAEGEKVWNKVLGVFEIEADLDQMRTFYSCLYRSVLFPRMFYEYGADGKPIHYSPYNGKILPGYLFTDTGFWDSFRGELPMINLIYPSMSRQMEEGFLNAYLESGFFPEWASPGHRDCMVGNNSASVVADAYIKGLRGYDIETLWEALKHDANSQLPRTASGRVAYEEYNKLGYVPNNIGIGQNVARTLEYAYNDWTIYTLGKKLGKPASEIDIFKQRANNYKNVYDPKYKLMVGRSDKGEFNPTFKGTDWSRDFCEGNSWHWSFCVFHDPQGLIDLMGGKKEFNHMMDSVFKMPSRLGMDSRGMIHEMREMQDRKSVV